MRAPHQLLHSRTRVRPRYALLPLEGYPLSRLPNWQGAEARILASPALGAQFVQYFIQLAPGGGTKHVADGRVETFLYLLSGRAMLDLDGKRRGRNAETAQGGGRLAIGIDAMRRDIHIRDVVRTAEIECMFLNAVR